MKRTGLVEEMMTTNESSGKPAELREAAPGIQVAGRMECTINDHERRALSLIGEEQRKPLPDNALIACLCDAVRLAREISPAPAPSTSERELAETFLTSIGQFKRQLEGVEIGGNHVTVLAYLIALHSRERDAALRELTDATDDFLNTMLNSRTHAQRERLANALAAARALAAQEGSNE